MVPFIVMSSSPKSLPMPSPDIARKQSVATVWPGAEVQLWVTVCHPPKFGGHFRTCHGAISHHCRRAGWSLESVRPDTLKV